MTSGCTYGRDCDSLNNPRPYRYFRLALTSLCPMNWGVSTISGRVAFPRLVVKRILSYEGCGLPGKRLLLILNLLRVCGLEAGHMDTSNLLEEFPREDVECLYLWMTQRINHLVGDGFVIRSGIMRTPRWPPITFFKPHRSHEPGLYFRYDSGLDFMTTSVKHLFDPVLEYLSCTLTGCSARVLCFEGYIRTDPNHRHAPAPNSSWTLLHPSPPEPLAADILDTMCSAMCPLCLVLALEISPFTIVRE